MTKWLRERQFMLCKGETIEIKWDVLNYVAGN